MRLNDQRNPRLIVCSAALGVRHFLLYLAFVMVYSFASGLLIHLFA